MERVTIACEGELENPHQWTFIGQYARVYPEQARKGFCWNCGEPNESGELVLIGQAPSCDHCGASEAPPFAPATGYTWMPVEQWDDNGRIRRARAFQFRLDAERPQGSQGFMRVDARRKLTEPRTQLRFRCKPCGYKLLRNEPPTLPQVLDILVANGQYEITPRALIRRLDAFPRNAQQ